MLARPRRLWAVPAALILGFGAVVVPLAPAFAASVTVTTTSDSLDAAGSCAAVTLAALPGPADPRITLSDGERSIERVPLYGKAPSDFVAEANALLVGRGVTLRFEAPPAPDAEAAE